MPPEDNTTTTDSTAPTEVTPTEPSTPTPEPTTEQVEAKFSQDQVNEMISKRLAKERGRIERQVRDELAAKPTPKKETPKPKPKSDATGEAAELLSEMRQLKRELSFEKRLSGLRLDDDDRETLDAVYDPDNTTAFDRLIERFGIGKESAPAPTPEPVAEQPKANPSAPAIAQPKEPTYESPGDPGGVPNPVYHTDPRQWSKTDIETLKAKGEFFKRVEAWRKNKVSGTAFPAKGG